MGGEAGPVFRQKSGRFSKEISFFPGDFGGFPVFAGDRRRFEWRTHRKSFSPTWCG